MPQCGPVRQTVLLPLPPFEPYNHGVAKQTEKMIRPKRL